MKICAYCDEQQEGGKFCQNCGWKFEGEEEDPFIQMSSFTLSLIVIGTMVCTIVTMSWLGY